MNDNAVASDVVRDLVVARDISESFGGFPALEAVYLADVVMVMAARPGRIIERLPVDLARPRTIDMVGSETLGRLRNRIGHLIAEPQP